MDNISMGEQMSERHVATEAAAAEARVMEYLRDRRHFEIEAASITHREDADGLVRLDDGTTVATDLMLQRLYDAFQRRHRAHAGLIQLEGYRLAEPPSVDPATTEVVAIEIMGGSAVLVSREENPPSTGLPPSEYEYQLVKEGDDWRLADRCWIERRVGSIDRIPGLL